MISQHGTDVRISIRVQPRASRTECVGVHGDALKIRIAAPPVDGAANEELVRWLSRTLRIAAGRVRVLTGESGRSKIVEIHEADADAVRRVLVG